MSMGLDYIKQNKGKISIVVLVVIILILSGFIYVFILGDSGGDQKLIQDDAQLTTEAPNCSNITHDGDGSTSNPYEITDVYELQCADDFRGKYVLMNDIDASNTDEWNNGTGFEPIDSIGSLDGQGYTINELYINRTDEENVALINSLDSTSTVNDINVVNINTTGYERVSGIVGRNNGEITNSYVEGTVTGELWVGGIAGANDGSISNSYSEGYINGGNLIGGLVGRNSDTIINSNSTSTINGSDEVGGLVGYNWHSGIIENSYATGEVSGSTDVGGLVGYNRQHPVEDNTNGEIIKSFSTGDVSGGSNTGGFVGGNSGTISKSYATGDVDGFSRRTGNLVGDNSYGYVTLSYSVGDGGEMIGTNVGSGMSGVDTNGSVSKSYWSSDELNPSSSKGTELENNDMKGDVYDSRFESDIVENDAFIGIEYEYPILHWEQ